MASFARRSVFSAQALRRAQLSYVLLIGFQSLTNSFANLAQNLFVNTLALAQIGDPSQNKADPRQRKFARLPCAIRYP
jgi:hypothetical protein